MYLEMNLSFTLERRREDSVRGGDITENDSLSSLWRDSRIVLRAPDERRLMDNFMADSSYSISFEKVTDSLSPFRADLSLCSLYELMFLEPLGVVIMEISVNYQYNMKRSPDSNTIITHQYDIQE